MKFFKQTLVAALAAVTMAGSASAAWNFQEVNSDISADETWTADTVYILNRLIFVEPGATLTIEPGTIIRGITTAQSDLGAEPGCLIVSRGATIIANGTVDQPIIMTSIDDPNVPGGAATIPSPSFTNSQGRTLNSGVDYGVLNYQLTATGSPDNAFAYNALWGGLITLGDAFVSQNTGGLAFPYTPGDLVLGTFTDDPLNVGQDFIEGIDPGSLSDARSAFSVYGGVDDTHDAGIVRFVQIRYGGFTIGNANEINSFTYGGCGDSSSFEFIESAFNQDDGYEMFGGKLDARFFFGHYVADDTFDGDEGMRGQNQFYFALQSDDAIQPPSGGGAADKIFEYDGPESGNVGSGLPNTEIESYNMTLFGVVAGVDADGGGIYNFYNMLFQGGITTCVKGGPGTVTATNLHHDGTTGVWSAAPVGEVVGALKSSVVSYTTPYATIDPRIAAADAALAIDGPDAPGVPAGLGYAGFQRDNHFLGWTMLDDLGVAPATNVARVTMTVDASGANPVIGFTAPTGTIGGRAPICLIERSADGGKTFEPIATTTTTGAQSYTDTATSLASGDSVQYRVFAL